MKAPHGLDEVRACYGDVKIDKTPSGWRIISPIGWEATSMVLLKGLPGLPTRKLYVHRVIIMPLTNALEQWQRTCPDYAVKTLGCFNPRPKRTSAATYGVVGWEQGLSLHSVGAAVDINAAANPMRPTLVTNMPDAFVKAFKDQGFVWGGEFKGQKDAMHFQFCENY